MPSARRPSERRWSNRDVRRQVDRHRALWLWGLLLGLAVAAIPTAFHLYHQNRCLKLGYEINALREERADLLEQHRRLLEQQATLEAPASVENWSTERHGMVRPSPGQVIVVRQSVPGREGLLAQETRSGRE